MKKKLVMAVLCAMLSVSLIACGAKDDTEETAQSGEELQEEEPQEQEETQEQEEEVAGGDEDVAATDELPEGNMIENGDFADGVGAWSMYLNGGQATLSTNDEQQLVVDIPQTGSLDYSVQAYYDGFKIDKGVVYKFSFDMAVSTPRTVVWRIQLNGGDYHAYFTDTIAATTEMQHYEYEVTMEEDSDPAPRLCFNLGTYDGDGELGEHTVTLDNFELYVEDSSGRVSSDTGADQPDINVSQVGYLPNETKKATFRGESIGDSFQVIDVASGESVFTGQITGEKDNASSQENCAVGDFSSVTKEGTYKIVSDSCGESFEFQIGENVYADLFKDTLRMLYLQRCGTELTSDLAGDFAHPVCHTGGAAVYGSSSSATKDVSGGWHDAGDYGRYVVSGAKAVADLLLAYEEYPAVFGDDTDIPESGNGVPDVLDEARYELTWLFKMQDESGGVYHKVTCENFPGTVLPQEETEQLVLSPISNCATGDFAAVMAMAARVYKDSDKAFADKCLAASEKALAYFEAHKDAQGFTNPSGIVTGEYPDGSSTDEYFWALAELYKTTGDSDYLGKMNESTLPDLADGLGWADVDAYGMHAYMTSENSSASLKSTFTKQWDDMIAGKLQTMDQDAYASTLGSTYPWGSNMSIANNGMLFLMAYETAQKDGDSKAAEYLSAAQSQLSYLLGDNANSYCFVTGYGTLSPQDTHHRPSQVLGKTMKGMLVGGPDSNLEDPYAQSTLSGVAAAKCYADSSQSYSCNEVTVYWNSPLIYLLAGIMSH